MTSHLEKKTNAKRSEKDYQFFQHYVRRNAYVNDYYLCYFSCSLLLWDPQFHEACFKRLLRNRGRGKKVKAEDTEVSHYPYHYEVEVEGMTCNQCKKRVENAFNEKKGFYAKVNLKQKKAQVYAKEQISIQEIRDIVRRSGYDPGTCKKQ